jgi:hypothetical protein
MSAPSRRQLLLEHAVRPLADGVRECVECSFKFAAGCDSAAWNNHWKSFHATKLAALLLPLQPVAAAACDDDQSVVSTESLLSHPLPKKRKVSSSSTSSSKQSSLTTLFGAVGSNRAQASLARLLTQSSIGVNVVSTAEFKEFMHDVGWTMALPTRLSLKTSMLQQSRDLRARLVERLRSSPLTVAVDGWTNVRHEKVTNVILIAQGVAYYWCSIVNSHEKNDAGWMADRLAIVFRTLLDTHSLRITALVVDNESVNKATHARLVDEFPFLVHVPCAAHTVQLAVRSCLALPTFAATLTQLNALIRFFDAKENRHALKQAQMMRGVPQRVVVKPNDTRWSSTLFAAERMLLLRREVECCFNEESLPVIASKEAFFKSLADLCAFLKPFQVATDTIQNDKATLFTVYTQLPFSSHTLQSAATLPPRAPCWRDGNDGSTSLRRSLLLFSHSPPSLPLSMPTAGKRATSFATSGRSI